MRAKQRPIGLIMAVIMIAAVVAMVGCTAAPAPASPSAPAAPAAPAAPQAPQAPKTLTIGIDYSLIWPLGLDAKKIIDWDIEKTDAAGGIDIGGQKYLLRYSWADNKFDPGLAKTAAQKLLSQDGCKFIMGDLATESVIPMAESEHFVFSCIPNNIHVFDPSYQWTWQCGIGVTNFLMTIPYVATKYPNAKTFLGGYGDDANGRGFAGICGDIATKSGLTRLEDQFYNAKATDLSALGTKIKQINPDILAVVGGGPPGDSMVLKAAYGAGWKGAIIGASTVPAETMVAIAGAEPVEGMISLAWPMEFDPTNALGKQWKQDYIAKNGKYDNPETVESIAWYVFKQALQQAGSIEPAKVKAVLDSGPKHLSPMGEGKLFPRPDLGVNRAVCVTYGDLIMKQVSGGKPKLLETLDWAKTMKLFNTQFGTNLPTP
jgi:branched-chain amino acid transport system substrate-binding protein